MSIKNLHIPNTQDLFAQNLTLEGDLEIQNLTVDVNIISNNIETEDLTVNNNLISNDIETGDLTVNGNLISANINNSSTIDTQIINSTNANIDNLQLTFPIDWIAATTGSTNLNTISYVFSTYYDYGEHVECNMTGQIQATVALSPVTVFFNPPILPSVVFPTQLNAAGSGVRYSTTTGVVEPIAVFSRVGTTDLGLYLVPSDTNLINFEVKFVYYK